MSCDGIKKIEITGALINSLCFSFKMKIFFFCLVSCIMRSLATTDWNHSVFQFPKGIYYGVSTSAYQIEGAWNVDGKGESVWDRYLHERPEDFASGPNGDTACDSYHNYMRDVEMLRELGADFYLFSISWSRILPTGFATNINLKGLEYYRNLTNELGRYGMFALATMYNNDLPQALEDLGGWLNPDIVHWFEDYARVLFKNLPGIKHWITINEPSRCFIMYGGGKMPPGINDKGNSDYICVKNMLLAHAKVYRLFDQMFRQTNISEGMVGMSLALDWVDPFNDTYTKVLNYSAQVYREFTIDLYLHPFLSKEGRFPPLVRKIVDKNSKKEGRETSRLPAFSKEEAELLLNALDFIGVNFYTSYYVNNLEIGKKMVYTNLPLDVNLNLTQSMLWRQSKTPGIKLTSYGLHRLCMYLNHKYKKTIYITELGWAADVGRSDFERYYSIFRYLKALIWAISEGAKIKVISFWSLMDTIEWTAGATERYGLYEVDFDSPNKTRLPRLTAHFFRHLTETHIVDEEVSFPLSYNLRTSPRRRSMIPEGEILYFMFHVTKDSPTIKEQGSESNVTAANMAQANTILQQEHTEL